MTGATDTASSPAARHAVKIKQSEYEAAALLLARIERGQVDVGILSLGDFARDAYRRVEDMFAWPEFDSCRRMTMIGCGPLPVTVLHVAVRCPHIELEAVDVDNEALDMAGRVAAALGLDGIRFCHGDGVNHKYDQADIVYIANLIQSKSAVLRRVAQTASADALVILRDPTRAGVAVAEVGLDQIGDDFTLAGLGADSDLFMSRHVFLRLAEG